MLSMIHFQLCGLAIIIFIIFAHFFRRTKWLITERFFESFLFVVLTGLLLDISSVFAIAHRDKIPVITDIISKFYLISIVLIALMTLSYLFWELFWQTEKMKKFFLPMGIVLACIFMSYLFLPINYFCDLEARIIYSYGTAVLMTYICSGFFLISCLILLFVFWRSTPPNKKRPVMVIVLSFLISGLIQFNNNRLLIVGFAMSMSAMMIYLYMENPYQRIDKELEINNEHAWVLYINQMFMLCKPFNMVSIYINDLDSIADIFGNINKTKLLMSVANFLQSQK